MKFCCRFRTSAAERLIRGTEAFNWESLPKNHPDTGSLTMAGWISFLDTIIRRTVASMMVYLVGHTVFSLLISNKHILLFNAWFPFDWSVSPVYQLINLQQVNKRITIFLYLYN
jgi:hypothetical protein